MERLRNVRAGASSALAAVLGLAAVVALWEGYKWVGQQTDDRWPGTGLGLPVRTDDLTMPHAVDIWNTLWEPVQRGRDQTLASFLLDSAWFTLREAALGFLIGSVLGLLLAVVMLRFRSAEHGLLPWINVSQTVPLIALAPIVVTWARGTWMTDTQAVALIAAYLTFFPVAVNGLRGLQSPAAADVELMRSYAASWWHTLVKLRLPASRPYLFPAFKLAATLSVVGAIVGEISAGVRGGLGRVILEFFSRYSTGPPRLYAAVLAAGLLGLFVFGLVGAAERLLLRRQGARPGAVGSGGS
ncbi:MAG: ABC transporter permease [Actinomycetota bacterium]